MWQHAGGSRANPYAFPSDRKVIVESSIKLASLDLDDKKWPLVISRLQSVETANRGALDTETTCWANYLIACALSGEDKKEDARVLFDQIARDAGDSSGWRAWGIYRASEIMAIVRAFLIQFDDGNTAESLRLLHLMAKDVQSSKENPLSSFGILPSYRRESRMCRRTGAPGRDGGHNG